ncbi:MAG TPA: zinc dependent phospholipase C family protein [Mobilitalea sp.]|nr:zinc dependent phospholipase C family protein [Mobilitalea sp.]
MVIIMAGVITHMVIAREMLKALPKGIIQNEALLCLGTLAPDAIHAREGYVREHKKHTHLRDDILDKDFIKPESQTLFHERVAEFILENRERKDGLLDLYRGYVIHLLTDELFMLSIREEFREKMEKLGIDQYDKEFFQYIVTDQNRNDLLLVKNYEGIDEIRRWMEEVPIYPIDGYLSENEMRISREWMIRHHFIEDNELLDPMFISYERILEFIKMATKNILERLSEGGSLPRML